MELATTTRAGIQQEFELWHPRVPAAAAIHARYAAARLTISALPFGSPRRRAVVASIAAHCLAASITPADALASYHKHPDGPTGWTWCNAVIKAAAEI